MKREQARIHRTNTNGHQWFNALVAKETYDFMDEYKGLFSFGVALDRLVDEVQSLRKKISEKP